MARILDRTLIGVIAAAVGVGVATDFSVLLAGAATLGTFAYFVAAVLVGGERRQTWARSDDRPRRTRPT